MFPTLFGTFGSRRSNVATDRSAKAETAAQDATSVRHDVLSLEEVRLVIEDGLLMVLGPEGDPVPPDAFRAAVFANADARVSLDGEGEVSAGKALAVLQAQTNGMLVAGEKSDGWILSMLGVGPQPEMAPVEDLQAEAEAQTVDSEPGTRPGQRDETNPDASGSGGLSQIPLAIVPPCPEGLEPAVVTVVALSGLPDGAVLSAGSDEGHGCWLLSPADLDGLMLQVPCNSPESILIKVTAIAITGPSGDLASAQADLMLDCRPSSPLPGGEPEPPASAPRSISVDLAPEFLADPASDVLVVRGVPGGMSLSAGVYDSSICGWVLRPSEASGLRIEPTADSPGQFTITILGISLTGSGPRQARVLASIPIAFD